MKRPSPSKTLSFQSKLESISDELAYFAVPVPEKITLALKTKAAFPIRAQINGGKPFVGSFYPIGGGRHSMRVKAEVRKDAKIKEGDRVRVEFTVRDRAAEISLPKDLVSALKAEGVLEAFKSIPAGEQSFTLRKIDAAVKPETRSKKIHEAVESAHRRREKK